MAASSSTPNTRRRAGPKGFEVQVNNSYRPDPRKTGSLYKMQNLKESPVKDGEWFTMHMMVEGKHVTVDVDGRKLVDWTEPSPPQAAVGSCRAGCWSSGTFALQGHDERSTVYYKNIYVKPLFPFCGLPRPPQGRPDASMTWSQLAQKRRSRSASPRTAASVSRPRTTRPCEQSLAKLEGKPVYRAMQAEGREWVKMFSPEMIAKFDYVFTDSMTWTNDRGKRMRLWMPNEVEVGDKQAFMDMLVERTVGILNNEPIDIYVNPTFLPAVIAKEYDTLWTDERMDKVIQAAVKNGVAIEINARYKLPSEKFIRRAKAAGAKFSFGTNNGGKDDLGDLAYSRLMAGRCGLTKDDMFVPKPDGQKPVQKKGLPR